MDLVRVESQGAVARVVMDRPDKRNALSAALQSALRDALSGLAAANEPPRALVISGAGPVFCAGGDLEAMPARVGRPHATAAYMREEYARTVLAVARFPAPTIASVQGAAIGAGLGLALACDHVHVTADARLAASQTGIGLVPDGGTSFFLLRSLGERLALELVQTGRALSGSEAAALSLVNAAHPDAASLEAAVSQTAQTLAARPTKALVLARRLVRDPGPGSLEEALDNEAAAQALAYATDDLAEGVKAALEKRKPAFRGR